MFIILFDLDLYSENDIFCKLLKLLYYIVQCLLSKMTRRGFFIFIIFSDTYTCSYVV